MVERYPQFLSSIWLPNGSGRLQQITVVFQKGTISTPNMFCRPFLGGDEFSGRSIPTQKKTTESSADLRGNPDLAQDLTDTQNGYGSRWIKMVCQCVMASWIHFGWWKPPLGRSWSKDIRYDLWVHEWRLNPMMWMMSPFDGFTRFHLYLELFLIRCSKPKIFQISPVNYYPILYIRFSWLTFLNISCSLKIFTQYLYAWFSRHFCWLSSLFLLYKSTFSWFKHHVFPAPGSSRGFFHPRWPLRWATWAVLPWTWAPTWRWPAIGGLGE